MSKEGLSFFRDYFSVQDSSVFEPLFLAQYLMIPVNTIIKYSLLPWMTSIIGTVGDKAKAQKIKAEIFLRYELLKDLMSIVKTHGRNTEYNFMNNPKLKKFIEGESGDKELGDKSKNILVFDSFITIWLITLPEKFVEWYKHHNTLEEINSDLGPSLNYIEDPNFPNFHPDSYLLL